ncbi:cupin domain-containing protein [Leucobacter sp. 1207-22]|uniref:cupin domain-containing protein n=1 Tax=Leucobacter sp. 1207-22 TaxID=2604456 RepID=UPI004062A446
MSAELLPEGKNLAVSATTTPIELEPVDAADTVSGLPRQGIAELGTMGTADVGIWELREGIVTDTEVDELFVVLSGGARIEFLDNENNVIDGPVEVAQGDVMRLVGGSRTRWTVENHIRKVYIASE